MIYLCTVELCVDKRARVRRNRVPGVLVDIIILLYARCRCRYCYFCTLPLKIKMARSVRSSRIPPRTTWQLHQRNSTGLDRCTNSNYVHCRGIRTRVEIEIGFVNLFLLCRRSPHLAAIWSVSKPRVWSVLSACGVTHTTFYNICISSEAPVLVGSTALLICPNFLVLC